MLNGWTPVDPPVIPSRTTLQGIHCAALRIKTMVTGAVARLRGIDVLRYRGGFLERRTVGSGIDTALMTKMIDSRLVRGLNDLRIQLRKKLA